MVCLFKWVNGDDAFTLIPLWLSLSLEHLSFSLSFSSPNHYGHTPIFNQNHHHIAPTTITITANYTPSPIASPTISFCTHNYTNTQLLEVRDNSNSTDTTICNLSFFCLALCNTCTKVASAFTFNEYTYTWK